MFFVSDDSKGYQVFCFDTLLQVLILNELDAPVEGRVTVQQSTARISATSKRPSTTSRRKTRPSTEARPQDAREKPQGCADSAQRYRAVCHNFLA
jgi:hypothetical protein